MLEASIGDTQKITLSQRNKYIRKVAKDRNRLSYQIKTDIKNLPKIRVSRDAQKLENHLLIPCVNDVLIKYKDWEELKKFLDDGTLTPKAFSQIGLLSLEEGCPKKILMAILDKSDLTYKEIYELAEGIAPIEKRLIVEASSTAISEPLSDNELLKYIKKLPKECLEETLIGLSLKGRVNLIHNLLRANPTLDPNKGRLTDNLDLFAYDIITPEVETLLDQTIYAIKFFSDFEPNQEGLEPCNTSSTTATPNKTIEDIVCQKEAGILNELQKLKKYLLEKHPIKAKTGNEILEEKSNENSKC